VVTRAVAAKHLSVFARLSSVLTGKNLPNDDLAKAYFARIRAESAPGLEALLKRFAALETSNKDIERGVREKIMLDPKLGATAKRILLLWYAGGLPDNNRNWAIESAEHYYRALVWDAIAAHPPTLSNGYYGHWKYPPES